jgi:hypothetical protein
LFQGWQEITNSIFCGGRSWPRQQMDVWVLHIAGTIAERHNREPKNLKKLFTRSS